MQKANNSTTLFISILVGLGWAFSSFNLHASGFTLRLENDSNSRFGVKNSIVEADKTTILFWTWPDRQDPNAGKACAMNYYSLTLQPGLVDVRPQLIAKDACAGRGMLHGALLDDGSGKFIIQDRLEQWRDGQNVSSNSFSSMEKMGPLNVNSRETGSQFADLSPAGDLLMAIMVSGTANSGQPGASWVITSVDPKNEQRWAHKYDQSASIESLWAGQGGAALLYLSTIDKASMVPIPEPQLLVISMSGQASLIKLVEVPEAIDLSAIKPGSMVEYQKYVQQSKDKPREKIARFSARPRQDGGFDVLFGRESSQYDRDGHFLVRLASDGSVIAENQIQTSIEDHGLDQWFDFYVNEDQLVLLSSYGVSQAGVSSQRKTWPQTIVSQIDLDSGRIVSHLIPLDRQYLEAAMNAGDEGQQYLEGKPGGEPVLLTTLGGIPLAISTGWIRKRGTLRIYEVTDDLVAFTEAYDKIQASQLKSRQKKTDKQARQQQMNSVMKDATGLTTDEFEALSDEEKTRVLMKDGNMEAVTALVMQQMQAAQAGLTPEQAAQVQASMGQLQQMTAGADNSTSDTPEPVQASAEKPKSKASFTVDALMRGHIRFNASDGVAITLNIINRQNGDELMTREFADGEIDEYFSLGRYKLPVDQIGALIQRLDGEVIEDLKPEIK